MLERVNHHRHPEFIRSQTMKGGNERIELTVAIVMFAVTVLLCLLSESPKLSNDLRRLWNEDDTLPYDSSPFRISIATF